MTPLKIKILDELRSSPALAKYMYEKGFVESTKVIEPDVDIETIVDGKNIESITGGGKTYIRATFGHSGDVLEKMNFGKYVKYDGPYKVFCITHTSPFGLGAVNYNRTFNILNTPERCDNKGIKLYIDIDEARSKYGVEFWSQVGDRYKNKIFCFDTNLRFAFFKIEYSGAYNMPENLTNIHGKTIDFLKSMMHKIPEEDRSRLAILQVQKLIIQESSEDDI